MGLGSKTRTILRSEEKISDETLLSSIIPFADSGLLGYAMDFALKNVLKCDDSTFFVGSHTQGHSYMYVWSQVGGDASTGRWEAANDIKSYYNDYCPPNYGSGGMHDEPGSGSFVPSLVVAPVDPTRVYYAFVSAVVEADGSTSTLFPANASSWVGLTIPWMGITMTKD